MIMSYVDYPPAPYIIKLRREMGLQAFRDAFIDENNNVKDDAPEKVKEEIAMLRKAREEATK